MCKYVADDSDAELPVLNQIPANNLMKYGSIVLCSGVYGGGVPRGLLVWLSQLERTSLQKNAKIYVLLTWFGRGQSDKSAIKELKDILEKKNMSLENDCMTCYGKGMGVIRQGHPNKEDCEKAVTWVMARTSRSPRPA
ncbi:MAG: hypothetical protein JW768_05390 [Chitinispirillaceae bacterium]|nr:hypothetical protein [Chitinispirillaceae bacterium]